MAIEILRASRRSRLRSVLFDFDGTLSLIREGWQEVMVGYMMDVLGSLRTHESEQELRQIISEFVTRLTGKQTIYQMLQLVEEITKRGGKAEDPLFYKRQYHERLWDRIHNRVEALRARHTSPQQWLVPGSLEILDTFERRGVRLHLASGTDQPWVREEAQLLGIAHFFEGRIYGALDQYERFSKKMLIARIVEEEKLEGSSFAAFGDGYVEIENTKQVGGTAVGVASDEAHPGQIDPWKRRRLIEAGADVIVTDFHEQEALVDYLWAVDETR